MFKEIIKEMFHPSKAAIIASLKRSDGLPVSEVAKEVDMSYMGVKQHCINLEKMGFLETVKIPRKDVGRPEKLYRLTSKCDDLFPVAGAEITIDILKDVSELYGQDAPEKLLRKYFNRKTKELSPLISVNASMKEKVTLLSELLENQGFFMSADYKEEDSISLMEYHNPFRSIIEIYPVCREIQNEMFKDILDLNTSFITIDGSHGQKQVKYVFKRLAQVA